MTTETTETETFLSPDVSVTKTEVFDIEFARQIAKNHPEREVRELVRRYIKGCSKGNQFDAHYKLGKHIKSEQLGRFCVLRGIGLQAFSNDVRAALAALFYWDIDIVNAQPTLLVQYCEKRGWVCENIKRYVAARDEMLDEVCGHLSIDRWEAKERIIALFFGSTRVDDLPESVRELGRECRQIADNILRSSSKELKTLVKGANGAARAMAYTLQTEERTCLLAMDKALAKRGRSMDVLIHDGGLVRKKEGEQHFPTSILREIEKDVEVETGYRIQLAVKEMKTKLVKETKEDDDYEEIKAEFEKTYFKLLNPPCYVRSVEKDVHILTKSDLILQRENIVCSTGKKFLTQWFDDPTIRTYEKLVFQPDENDVPEGCFNIFAGFRTKPVAHDVDLSRIHELVYLLAGKEEKMKTYLDMWFAHLVQKPTVKTRTALCIIGEQGVGKDTFVDFFGQKLIGAGCFYNTSSPENDIFARFNDATKQTVLVKFEEANFKTNKTNADKLKSIITADTQNIETKGKPSYTLPSFTNVVMTTNHDVPIVIEPTDRRFEITRASSDRMGDHEFWNAIHEEMEKPEVQEAYMHYLMTLDISGFNPARDRVLSVAYNEVKTAMAPYHAQYFQTVLMEELDSNRPIVYKASALYMAMKDYTKFELTATKLGRDLREYIECDAIVKTVGKMCATYGIDQEKTKAYLIKKGWWADL